MEKSAASYLASWIRCLERVKGPGRRLAKVERVVVIVWYLWGRRHLTHAHCICRLPWSVTLLLKLWLLFSQFSAQLLSGEMACSCIKRILGLDGGIPWTWVCFFFVAHLDSAMNGCLRVHLEFAPLDSVSGLMEWWLLSKPGYAGRSSWLQGDDKIC